jgi:hypothetical protein
VLGLCERFGCLPEVLYETDAELLRLLQIEALGRPKDKDAPAGG